ncbi:CD209 antigen-like protein C isoform X2 [Sebastes fasciatus]|uniref:CD209 antigen-like protein C isoform X2 n=1 Tax=Sebastes fasciatus TaxID=394691 RepID=UPI003D9F10A0
MTPDASSKKEKLFGLVVVSFGLLCVLQATVNISLRLALYSPGAKTPDFEAIIKNLTEEREDLKRKLSSWSSNCQPRWVYFKHSCYYFSSNVKSWQKSRDYCQQKGADLMIINSKEEQEFGSQYKRNTWIGLTDRETEGIWKWVDGTALGTSYWYTGEPNNNNNDEDCGVLWGFGKENNWNDVPCSIQINWICEKVGPP